MNENDNASQNNNDELLNGFIISDTGEVMDVKISVKTRTLLFIKLVKMMNSLIKILTMRI